MTVERKRKRPPGEPSSGWDRKETVKDWSRCGFYGRKNQREKTHKFNDILASINTEKINK